MRESERHLSLLYDNVSDIIFYLSVEPDEKFRFLSINPAFLKATGLTESQIVGKLVQEIIPEPSLTMVLGNYREAIRDKKTVRWEETSVYPAGTKHGEVSVTPIFDATGRCTNLIGAVHDITERKQVEEVLRESEKRYRSLFENMLEGYAYCKMFFDHDKPQDFVYINVNSAFEKLTGLKNVVGKKVSEVIPGIKESNPELFEIYGRVALTGKAERFETYVEPLGIWFSISVYSPEEEYFVAVFDNITDRKRAEQEIIKANRVYAVISQINQTIVRTRERDKLLADACRIAIEYGRFRMAWVGLVDEKEKIVKPFAFDGVEEEYLSKIKRISISDVPEGRGPTGTAIREGKHFCCNDIANDPHMALWRDEALKRGYRSSIALPLTIQGKVIGAFSLYASETAFFNDEEIQLLEEVTDDIGYALEMIETEEMRKRAEEALRESEEQYRTVTESVNDAIVAIDRNSRIILFANNSVEKIFGYSASELLGKEITILMPDRYRDRHRTAVTSYAETGVKHVNWKSTQFPGLHRSGKEIPLEISYGEYTRGGKKYFIGVVRDVTERKQAEEALLNAEKRYRTTLDHMLEGCQIIGFDWCYLYINDVAAKQGRHTKEELLGRTMMEIYPGIESTKMFLELRRCMKERIPHRMENEFMYPDGSKGWFHLSMEPVSEGVFILSEDITKEKQLDEELRKHREHLEELVIERTAQLEAANKELEAFSYSVSHDLRAPLRAIDGFSRLLIEQHSSQLDHEGQRFLKITIDSTAKMGQLIDDLLTFSRLSRQEIRKWSVDMEKLVRTLVDEAKQAELGRTVEVTIRSLTPANCDGSMMRQVWLNLISNAFKFTRRQSKPRVEIGSYGEGRDTVYFVKDNGAGFNMLYVEKLFAVFQRLHRQEEYEGTGVGLGIVQRLVHRHGGRVWAEGKVNEGATFYFTLQV